MPSLTISGISPGVGAGASITVQPPVGEAYCLTDFPIDNFLAVFIVWDNSVQIIDGIHAACIYYPDRAVELRIEYRTKEIYINNTTYAQVTNRSAGPANLGWIGYRVDPNKVISYIATVPNGGTLDIRPPPGQVWRITEVAAERFGGADYPDITWYITDGVLVNSVVMRETAYRGNEKRLNWYISNDIFLRLSPLGVGDNDVAIMGMIVDVVPFCGIQDVLGGGVLDIRPAAGQECVVTEYAGETWAGAVAATEAPDASLGIFDGANLSILTVAGSVIYSPIGRRGWAVDIDNDVYIRITEVSGLPNEIAWLGYVKREYNP